MAATIRPIASPSAAASFLKDTLAPKFPEHFKLLIGNIAASPELLGALAQNGKLRLVETEAEGKKTVFFDLREMLIGINTLDDKGKESLKKEKEAILSYPPFNTLLSQLGITGMQDAKKMIQLAEGEAPPTAPEGSIAAAGVVGAAAALVGLLGGGWIPLVAGIAAFAATYFIPGASQFVGEKVGLVSPAPKPQADEKSAPVPLDPKLLSQGGGQQQDGAQANAQETKKEAPSPGVIAQAQDAMQTVQGWAQTAQNVINPVQGVMNHLLPASKRQRERL